MPGTHCNALYLHNLKPCTFDDSVMDSLIALLLQKSFFAVNLGELDGVSSAGWQRFVDSRAMRSNRLRYRKHEYEYNRAVPRVNNMWWNPSNGCEYRKARGKRDRRQP
ncbi:hypothetical protein B484DRAFT_410803 [Ochromonadaceae sp. CCMP2298]|nr:hypothetical protein B484DRAFT_410803 [Ochromonadaceae sp. CCMP2298]